MSGALNVAIASDDRYAAGAIASLASIRLSLESNITLNVTFLHDIFDEGLKEKIRRTLNKFKGEIHLDFRQISFDFSNFPEFHTPSKMPYARLCLSDLCDFSRIIYIDSDFLVFKSLLGLFNSNMNGFGLMAAQDSLIKLVSQEMPPDSPFPVNPSQPYLNSGILLLDLDFIRSNKLFEKALEILSKFPQFFPFHDQSAINYVFKDCFKLMDDSFNIQNVRSRLSPVEAIQILSKNLGNIHFVSPKSKPWLFFSENPAETMFRILLDEIYPDWKSAAFRKDTFRWAIRQVFVNWYPMLFRIRGRLKSLLGRNQEPDFAAAQNWDLYLSDRRDLKNHRAELKALYSGWRNLIRRSMR